MSSDLETAKQIDRTDRVNRKAYHSPVFSNYGEVRRLTRANPGSGPDGPGADGDGALGDDSAS
jgi:hypothetical protein